MERVEQAAYKMDEYKDSIKEIVGGLFARLLQDKEQSISFFGNDDAYNKAVEMWRKKQFMEALVESTILVMDEDRIQVAIDEMFENNEELYKRISDFLDEDDSELPFN